ncbi:MAG: DNA polymerase III subunit gamma/tau [Candidatus Abyssubacteria bacterium]
MSYIVLARKWRPKRFKDVVGQEHVTTTLLNSLRSGRTAHAYLFVGPRGIGKTSTARIFAKALNCPESIDGEPCGECAVCREIGEGRSVDVLEIDGASNNGVEDIRTLRENVKIAPATLRYKVYIIDEVHMLSTGAFNAFLKTLEEPPAHVKFILATTEAHKIPTTVLSRCQRFDFRRITARQIYTRLKEMVEAEGIQIEDRPLFAIARSAEGSMRDAQSILDQLVSFSDREITLEDVHAMLGTVGLDVYRRVALALSEGDSHAVLKIIDDVMGRGKDLAQFLKELTFYFRNVLVAATADGEELIDLPDEDLKEVKDLSGRFKEVDLVRTVTELSELESRFRLLPSTRIALEMTLMRLAQSGAEISIDSILSKLTELERKLRGPQQKASRAKSPGHGGHSSGNPGTTVKETPSAQYEPEPDYINYHEEPEPTDEEAPPPEPDPEESLDDDKSQLSLWRQLLDEVQEHGMSIYSFLSSGRFCGVENGYAIVCFEPEKAYNKTHLEETQISKFLEKTLTQVAGAPLKLKFILEDERVPVPPVAQKEASPPMPSEEDLKQRRIERALENTVVRQAMELFKAKIVYVNG